MVRGDWAALDAAYAVREQEWIEHSLRNGRAVQLKHPDGSATLLFPNGTTGTVAAGAGDFTVHKNSNGDYDVVFAGQSSTPPSPPSIPPGTSISDAVAAISEYLDLNLASIEQNLQVGNKAAAEHLAATTKEFIRTCLREGTVTLSDFRDVKTYVGGGAFAHVFDGWIPWNADQGMWDSSLYYELFWYESLYQVPVFDIGYEVGVALQGNGDPFTGYMYPTEALYEEAAFELGFNLLALGLAGELKIPFASSTSRIAVVDQSIIADLQASGVKITPQNVVATSRNAAGQTVFLEKGNSSSGLTHILEAHGGDFARIGISPLEIPGVVTRAVTEGRFIGYQGAGTGRPIYQITIDGQTRNIAVTVADNGTSWERIRPALHENH